MNWAEPFIKDDKLYREFKKAQLNAENLKLDKYTFHDKEILTKFGKYLLQYVESVRRKK